MFFAISWKQTCASIRAGTFVFSLVFIKIKAAFTDIYVSVDPWVHAGLTRRCTASCIRGVFVFFVQWPLRTKHITVKAQTLRRCAPNPHIQTSRDGNALASLLLLDEKIVLHSFPACFVYVLIFFTSCSSIALCTASVPAAHFPLHTCVFTFSAIVPQVECHFHLNCSYYAQG